MSPITEAVLAWQNNNLDDTGLLRAIVSYRNWKFPISEAAAIETMAANAPPPLQLTTDSHGKSQLLLWSAPETYSTWAKAAANPAAQHFIDSTGHWIFNLPFREEVDEILLDPLTPPGLFYRKDQFPQLRAMAQTISLENDLADLRANRFTQAAVIRVRNYPRYVIAVAKSTEGQRLIIAPDHQERPFAPVFTADDAARKFIPRAQGGLHAGEELI